MVAAPRNDNTLPPANWRASGDRERLIPLDALEDLLFAEIGIAGRGGDVAPFCTAWRDRGRKGRRSLLARQLRLVRRLRGALICRDKNEHAQCRDEPAQMRVKAKSHKRDHLLPGSPLMPLIFSAISMSRLKMPTT